MHLIEWERTIAATFAVAAGQSEPDLFGLVVGGSTVSILRACVYAHHRESGTFAERVERACRMLEQGLCRPV